MPATWVSSKFEGRCPPDTVLLRCSIQDGRQKRVAISDQEAVQKVHRELQRVLGISCQPILTRVLHARKSIATIHPRSCPENGTAQGNPERVSRVILDGSLFRRSGHSGLHRVSTPDGPASR